MCTSAAFIKYFHSIFIFHYLRNHRFFYKMHDYILTLSCADRTGIVHAVSGWLLKQQGNILEAQQYGDPETKQFFLRIHFGLPAPSAPDTLRERFDIVARRSEEHTSELQSRGHLVCRLLLEKKNEEFVS